MKRDLLIAEFLAQPWALMPERITAAAAVLSRWANGGARAMDDDGFVDQRSAFEVRRQQAQSLSTSSAIAVLPLYGTIVQRAGMMTEWCGGTSTQQFTAAFRDAMADPSVSSILIDIDSPGGSVYGVSELADEIFSARGQKSIVAIANSLAASAGYWIGRAASELYVTPGGEVGSIGVWQAHEDWSKALEEQGVDVTLISAGKYKVEGNPYEALGDDAREFMQSRVNDYYAAFTKAVAKGSGVSIGDVRDKMGQGRVLGADAALAANMVNGIATFDEVIKKMQKDARSANRNAGRSAETKPSRLAAAMRDLQIMG